jgi:hypothetical protein
MSYIRIEPLGGLEDWSVQVTNRFTRRSATVFDTGGTYDVVREGDVSMYLNDCAPPYGSYSDHSIAVEAATELVA